MKPNLSIYYHQFCLTTPCTEVKVCLLQSFASLSWSGFLPHNRLLRSAKPMRQIHVSVFLCAVSVAHVWYHQRNFSEVKQGITFKISPMIICSERSSILQLWSAFWWLRASVVMGVWDPASWEDHGFTVEEHWSMQTKGMPRNHIPPSNMKTLWER